VHPQLQSGACARPLNFTVRSQPMSRRETQAHRLATLEEEFRRAICEELGLEAESKTSRYFTRKIPFIVDGRKYQDDRTAYLERLEKEIVALHGQLGDSDLGESLAVVEAFAEKLAAGLHSGARAGLARELLARLTSNNRSRGP
jgi:hypothetical protein